MSAAMMHPPISDPRVVEDATVDGGYLINFAGIIAMAKKGETTESRLLYMTYCQEYRALEGENLPHKEREKKAFLSAAARRGWNLAPAP